MYYVTRCILTGAAILIALKMRPGFESCGACIPGG